MTLARDRGDLDNCAIISLVRSDPAGAGIRRRRRGRGFSLSGTGLGGDRRPGRTGPNQGPGHPAAGEDVWICADPHGHIQAIGTDAAGPDLNDYLREISGGDDTAKDFRTWHATALAAVGLAVSEGAAASDSARQRAIARVVREVADYLGNTPAVARASYIDPRVIDCYQHGRTIRSVLGDLGRDSDFGDLATRGRAESAVVKLLPRRLSSCGPYRPWPAPASWTRRLPRHTSSRRPESASTPGRARNR